MGMSTPAMAFDFDAIVNRSTVFRNQAALHDAYVPNVMPQREEQIIKITTLLADVASGGIPSSFLVSGPPGTGKSATVHFVVRQLKKKGVQAFMTIVNCRQGRTFSAIFSDIAQALASQIGKREKVIKSGLGRREHVRRIVELVKEFGGGPMVIVLDEVDCIDDKDIIFDLIRLPQNNGLENAWISVVGVSNDPTFYDSFDASSQSSFEKERVIFPKYNCDQLKAIAVSRAEVAFKPGAIDYGLISRAAAKAGDDGDARRVLQVLESAGRIAQQQNCQKVMEWHLTDALGRVEVDAALESFRGMPLPQRIVMAAVLVRSLEAGKTGKVDSDDVYKLYTAMCTRVLGPDAVHTDRWMGDVLTEFDSLRLTRRRLDYRGRHGRSNVITLIAKPEDLLKTLLSSNDDGDKDFKEIVGKYQKAFETEGKLQPVVPTPKQTTIA